VARYRVEIEHQVAEPADGVRDVRGDGAPDPYSCDTGSTAVPVDAGRSVGGRREHLVGGEVVAYGVEQVRPTRVRDAGCQVLCRLRPDCLQPQPHCDRPAVTSWSLACPTPDSSLLETYELTDWECPGLWRLRSTGDTDTQRQPLRGVLRRTQRRHTKSQYDDGLIDTLTNRFVQREATCARLVGTRWSRWYIGHTDSMIALVSASVTTKP
jgi:hypothetical protein